MKFSIIYIMIVLFIIPSSSIADNASKINNKGIKSYNEKNLEESLNLFTEALVEQPDSPELRFNRGTALSALGEKEESIREFEKSAGTFEKNELSASSFFNAGNTYLVSGDLNEAIEEYKKAVKLDQTSEDIRYNLELALKMLENQQKQEEQKEQNEEDSEEQNDADKQPEQDQNGNEENNEEEQNNTDNDEQQNNDEKQNNQEQQSQQQEQEQQSMTQEEAQQILDALNNEEKEMFEIRKMKMLSEMSQDDDW